MSEYRVWQGEEEQLKDGNDFEAEWEGFVLREGSGTRSSDDHGRGGQRSLDAANALLGVEGCFVS